MISIVIPNFNSGAVLKKNLPKLFSLLKKSKLEHEVIVTDDASTDDSIETLRQAQGDIKIIESDVNTGFGSNVDRGIRAAKGEIVFILNAIDALPKDENYFKLMLKHFDVGAGSSRPVFSVGATKQDSMNHGSGEIYFNRGYFLHKRSDGPKKLSGWADGGAQALRKAYYLKIGGFDPIYKLYWEDVDLGYRAWKAGYKVIFEQKAILLHKKDEGPIAKTYSEKELRIMNLCGQFIFTWKNADLKYLILCELWEPYYMAIAIKNRDWDWFKAYWQCFSNIGQLIKRRFEQKKVAKISDSELLKII